MSVGKEILSAAHAPVQREEHRLHDVLHIHESDVLTPVAHGKVHMRGYAPCHQEIVFLARTVHARGAQNDVREVVAYRFEVAFSLKLAPAVCGVGARNVVLAYVAVGLPLAHGSVNAQRADEHETPQGHLQRQKSVHQILRPQGVHPVEVIAVKALRHSCGMHHVVERVVSETFSQPFSRREVKLYEVYALVGEIAPRARMPHGSPHVHASAQGFLNDKAADEAARAGYKNIAHFRSQLSLSDKSGCTEGS